MERPSLMAVGAQGCRHSGVVHEGSPVAWHGPTLPSFPCPCLQVGEGPQLTAIAELLEETIQRESRKMTVWEARERIFLVDTNGLVTRNRWGGWVWGRESIVCNHAVVGGEVFLVLWTATAWSRATGAGGGGRAGRGRVAMQQQVTDFRLLAQGPLSSSSDLLCFYHACAPGLQGGCGGFF